MQRVSLPAIPFLWRRCVVVGVAARNRGVGKNKRKTGKI